MRPTHTKRRIVDRVRAQARRADEIADQLASVQMAYAPEFRHQARTLRQWADVLDGRIDDSRDPRGKR